MYTWKLDKLVEFYGGRVRFFIFFYFFFYSQWSHWDKATLTKLSPESVGSKHSFDPEIFLLCPSLLFFEQKLKSMKFCCCCCHDILSWELGKLDFRFNSQLQHNHKCFFFVANIWKCFTFLRIKPQHFVLALAIRLLHINKYICIFLLCNIYYWLPAS